MDPSGASGLKRASSVLMDAAILEYLAPTAILLARGLRVVETRGDVSQTGLRASVRQVLKGPLVEEITAILGDTVQSTQTKDWRITAIPLPDDSGEPRHCVLFQDRRMEHALESAGENLALLLEDSESTSEELRVAVEELRAANDELRHANEELFSANQEVARLNARLENRARVLEESNLDLSRFLEGLRTPLVVLGGDLRLRRYTPPAEVALGLAAGDVGKAISDLPKLAALENACAGVAERQELILRDLDAGERSFQIMIRPFLSEDSRVEALLLALLPGRYRKRE